MMKESKRLGQIISNGKDAQLSGIPSGYSIIDEKLSGWQQGDLIILASRPSVGKSLFAKNLARNAAMKNIPVLYFSLEIQSKELCSQILQMELEESGISYEKHSELPLFVNDTYPLSVNELCFNAKESIRRYGVKLVIVDYLQLLQGPQEFRGQRSSEIEYIVMSLKALAREMANITVIALSQLSRYIGTEIKEPTCKDLRESSSIETVADVIIFLHREGELNSLIIAKNRHDGKVSKFTGLKKKGMLITE